MIFDEFASYLSKICLHSLLAGKRPLLWTIIASPKAGGFTVKSKWKNHLKTLKECEQRAKNNPFREGSRPSKTALSFGDANSRLGLIITRAPGHAGELAAALIKEAVQTLENVPQAVNERPFFLVITAGGDGTSLEALSALYRAPCEIRHDFAVLRLPMGTGNDGADAWELDTALDLLIKPSIICFQRALCLSTSSGKGPFLAFNILSAGLDAFVTNMTNKTKKKLPGDSYKLWVDLAALFYDLIYKVGYMDIRALNEEGKEVKVFREKVLLLAVGESGRRCYGSRKWILPDKRNVCAIKQMSVFRKIALKKLMSTGGHINHPEALLWNASRIEFTSQYPILAQMDGEAVLLEKKDFPAVIELTEPVIPILKKSPVPLQNR